MPDIKIKQKEKNEIPIKKIDRKAIYKTKLKDNLINIKERNNTNENEDTNPNNYSINRISKETRIATDKAINNFERYGRKAKREPMALFFLCKHEFQAWPSEHLGMELF